MIAARSETLLAFDFGERYLGVAVGDTEVGVAHPLGTIDARVSAERFRAVAEFITEWKPTRLIVGHPLSPEGAAHDLTRKAERFARQLGGRFGLPVTLQDERYSSAEAESRLRALGRGGRRYKNLAHPVAAQVILQAYLDESTQ